MAHALRHLILLADKILRVAAVVTSVLLVTQAGAQPAGAVPSVRFTVFAAAPIGDAAFVARYDSPPKKVEFYPTARSPRYEYTGPMPLRFLDPQDGSVVAEVTIPPEIRDALLLFSPIDPVERTGALGGVRYRVAVLDDSVSRQGPGSLTIVNLSELELSGAIGTRQVTLRAGLNPAIPVGRNANVLFRTPFRGRTYRAYAESLSLRRNERALLFLFPPFYAGSLEVQGRLLVDAPAALPK